MQTTTATKAGNAPDLLQGILSVQVRNEDKITEQDRVYCQHQQDMLYKTLDQIDRWYAVFKEEAEQYQAERKFHYEENGKVSMRDFYTYHNDRDDYSHNEFKPFDLINDLVDKNRNANANFANRIISYFNKTYNVSVPEYKIDEKTLPMGFRPVYETYVDAVIEHLGGKSFRETAVEELLARLNKVVKPAYWSKVKTELKKDKIIFPEIIRFDDNDVSVTDWYDLTTVNAEQIRFYKNGRIDVRFKDSAAAESCFKRLRLDEIILREN